MKKGLVLTMVMGGISALHAETFHIEKDGDGNLGEMTVSDIRNAVETNGSVRVVLNVVSGHNDYYQYYFQVGNNNAKDPTDDNVFTVESAGTAIYTLKDQNGHYIAPGNNGENVSTTDDATSAARFTLSEATPTSEYYSGFSYARMIRFTQSGTFLNCNSLNSYSRWYNGTGSYSCYVVWRVKTDAPEPPGPEPEPVIRPAAMNDPMLFIHFENGEMYAFPKEYADNCYESDGTLNIRTVWEETIVYHNVAFVTEDVPERPYFTSFKFNDKFNDQLFNDVVADIDSLTPADTLRMRVGCIGKRLTPSFKCNGDDVTVYIDTVPQKSKVSSQRFDKPVKYVLAYDHMKLVVAYEDGDERKTVLRPYGREVVVDVNLLAYNGANVPILYINTDDGQGITSKSTYKSATLRINGGGAFPDMEETPIQIKGRGNTTWNYPKKPYNFKFATKQSPLGMGKGKKWVLLANHQSNSIMSNAIAMKIAGMVGTEACNHILPVDVYLNDTYQGSYNLTEKIGISANSVDLDDESRAALVELDVLYDEPYKFRSPNQMPVNIKAPDFSDAEAGTAITAKDVERSFNAMENAVCNLDEDYPTHIDIEAACRFLLVNELVFNRELWHPKSCFAFCEDVTDPESPWKLGPVWDFDWAYGYPASHTYYVNFMTTDYFPHLMSGGSSSGRAGTFWYDIITGCKEGQQAYTRLWTDFMKNKLDALLEYVDDYLEYANPSFVANNKVWSNTAADQTGNANNAKVWLKQRAEFIYANWIEQYPEEEGTGIEAPFGRRTERTAAYDLSGRQVRNGYKGIAIVNGKKVLLK